MGRIADRNKRRTLAKKLRPPPGAELRYKRALTRAVRELHTDAMAWLQPRLGQLTQQDDRRAVAKSQLSSEFMGHVDGLVRKLGPKIEPAFMKLSKSLIKENSKAMAAVGLDVRGQLGPQIDHIREVNQRLITNAGRDYASDIAEVLDDPDNWGLRAEELASRLKERGSVSESRAELIARDQSSKTMGSINQFRQRHAGVTSYTWSGSLDERERETHLANEGKEFQWSDPPAETGHPTEDISCRCVAIPVIPDLEGDEET